MRKTYQPEVIRVGMDIFTILKDTDFLIENNIEDENLVLECLYDKLTDKFINGELERPYFTENEMKKILNHIIVESTVRSLVKKGLINTYSDDNTEEVVFLTDLGKAVGEKLISNDQK